MTCAPQGPLARPDIADTAVCARCDTPLTRAADSGDEWVWVPAVGLVVPRVGTRAVVNGACSEGGVMDAPRPWWQGYRDTPEPIEIDWCPVCDRAVFDDPRHERNDHTAPVRMPDGRHTHAGCQTDYPAVVARLEALHNADPLPAADLDLDYLGTATSRQAEYSAAQRDRDHRRDRGAL